MAENASPSRHGAENAEVRHPATGCRTSDGAKVGYREERIAQCE